MSASTLPPSGTSTLGTPEVPKKPTATVVKPDVGTAESMHPPHARGVLGEQAMGFHLGSQGYHIIEGPSGTATFIDPATGALNGHQITASGFDGVAFHPQTKDLIIYDNKAFQKIGNVSDASAITRNLQTNLDKTIGRMERSRQFIPRDGLATFNQALQKLKQARDALAAGRPWPAGCRLAISNAAGNSTGVAERLRRLGIQFIDFNEVRKIRRPPSVIRRGIKAVASRLRSSATTADKEALKRASRKYATKAGGQGAAKKGARFLEKAAPKVFRKFLVRASAKKAAKRAASFLPVVGWVFAGEDAVKGVEDILRGHTARGIAAIGLAGADVAADFLHAGDVVSGVGGTALSIGAQAATVAGQIKIEMDRAEEKLEQLRKEIADKDALPDDGRLRSEFDLDDEAIAELKAEFAAPNEKPEPTDDELPPPPEFAQDNPDLWSEESEVPAGDRWVDQPIASRSQSYAGSRVA